MAAIFLLSLIGIIIYKTIIVPTGDFQILQTGIAAIGILSCELTKKGTYRTVCKYRTINPLAEHCLEIRTDRCLEVSPEKELLTIIFYRQNQP